MTPLKSALARLRGRPLESYSRVRIGTAAVAALAVGVALTVTVNSLHLSEQTYHVEFVQAAGISAGDPVTDAGIPVGTVTGARLAGDHVVVTIKVKNDIAIGAGTRAAIKLTTLLGSHYVELRPAGGGTVPNHLIPLSNTEVPYDLETALQDATTTFGRIDADQIAQSMTTLSTQLQGTPALVPGVLDNMKTLATVMAQRRHEIGALLTGTSQLTAVIRNQQTDLASMFIQGQQVLAQIQTRRQAIRRMIEATTSLVQQLEPIAVNDRPEIQQLLANLAAMTNMVARHDDLLRNTLQILPVPWRLFANATGTGQELIGNAPGGALIDTFMCAVSERAEQVHRAPYYQDCK